jgi:hypothetical protein
MGYVVWDRCSIGGVGQTRGVWVGWGEVVGFWLLGGCWAVGIVCPLADYWFVVWVVVGVVVSLTVVVVRGVRLVVGAGDRVCGAGGVVLILLWLIVVVACGEFLVVSVCVKGDVVHVWRGWAWLVCCWVGVCVVVDGL